MTGYLWVCSPTVPMELLSESCSPSRSPSKTELGPLCRLDLTNLTRCAIKKKILSENLQEKINIGLKNCHFFPFLMLAEQKLKQRKKNICQIIWEIFNFDFFKIIGNFKILVYGFFSGMRKFVKYKWNNITN